MPKPIYKEISRDSEMKVPPNEIRYEPWDSDILKSSDKKIKISQEVPSKSKVSHVLNRSSPTYELEKFEKKALLIFDTMHIRDHRPRFGTEKDVEQLTTTFLQFGFEVIVHRDLTKAEVMKVLHEYSARDFTEYGCIAVAVLTHGSEGGLLLTADGQYFNENDIIRNFTGRKPTLATKPKVFIIQACRGMQNSIGVEVSNKGSTSTLSKYTEEKFYTIPMETDMIILHSSYNGTLSFRNPQYGSWFIQSLCKNINKLAKTRDLETILTAVKREVAIEHSHEEYNKGMADIQILKQMPVVTSTLIRKLYLRQYIMDKKPTLNGNSLREENKSESTENKTESSELIKNKTESSELRKNTTKSSKSIESKTESPSASGCYLEQFDDMQNCLKLYLEDHPNDSLGRRLYNMAKAFHGPSFNEPKKKMLAVIVQHLRDNNFEHFNYRHTYNQHNVMCESHLKTETEK